MVYAEQTTTSLDNESAMAAILQSGEVQYIAASTVRVNVLGSTDYTATRDKSIDLSLRIQLEGDVLPYLQHTHLSLHPLNNHYCHYTLYLLTSC